MPRGLSQDQPPQLQMHRRHKSRINQISSGIDQSISAVGPPCCDTALLIKFQLHHVLHFLLNSGFYPQFRIRPTGVSDSQRFSPPVLCCDQMSQEFVTLFLFFCRIYALFYCQARRHCLRLKFFTLLPFLFVPLLLTVEWVGSRKMPLLRLRLLNGWTGRGGN